MKLETLLKMLSQGPPEASVHIKYADRGELVTEELVAVEHEKLTEPQDWVIYLRGRP